MVQLLTVKYTKEEERVLLFSNVSGVIISVLATLLIGYLVGLFSNLKLAAANSIGWAMFMLKIGSIAAPICWTTTMTISLFLFRKRKIADLAQVRRMIPGTLVFPLTIAYVFSVLGLIIFPLCYLLLGHLSPILIMLVGMLALLPFVVLVGAILLPETPAGKGLRRHIGRLKG